MGGQGGERSSGGVEVEVSGIMTMQSGGEGKFLTNLLFNCIGRELEEESVILNANGAMLILNMLLDGEEAC